MVLGNRKASLATRYRFGWKYHIAVVSISFLFFMGYWYGVVRHAHPSHRMDLWILAAVGFAVFYINFLVGWSLCMVNYQFRWQRVPFVVFANACLVVVLLLVLSAVFGNLSIDFTGFKLAYLYTLFDGSVRNAVPYFLPMGGFLALSFVGFMVEWIYLPFANRDETERKIQQARQAWRRAQLDPHLLDTHLVMLSVITRESQTKAQLALDYTIKVIQFYIGGNDPGKPIKLAEEIECIASLIEIQRIRYGDALNWRLEIAGDVPDIAIIPMTLMPLAENMVRYAELNLAGAPAVMHVQMTDGDLFVTTENCIRIEEGRKSSGTGLSNLRERLEYAYPGRFRLNARNENGWYYVELVITGLTNPL